MNFPFNLSLSKCLTVCTARAASSVSNVLSALKIPMSRSSNLKVFKLPRMLNSTLASVLPTSIVLSVKSTVPRFVSFGVAFPVLMVPVALSRLVSARTCLLRLWVLAFALCFILPTSKVQHINASHNNENTTATTATATTTTHTHSFSNNNKNTCKSESCYCMLVYFFIYFGP